MLAQSQNNFNLLNLYVFGDSLCKGIIYNPENERYELSQNNFINLLTNSLKSKVKNFASFGATIKKGLKVFQRRQAEIVEPGIAILEFGGNDCDFLWPEVSKTPKSDHQPNVPINSYFESYKELINKLKIKNIIPIILSLPPLEPNRYFKVFSKNLNKENLLTFLGGSTKRIYQWHESYNSVLPNLASETGAFFIDIRRGFLEKRNPENYMCEDGIHPNEQGHKFIAEMIIEEINLLL